MGDLEPLNYIFFLKIMELAFLNALVSSDGTGVNGPAWNSGVGNRKLSVNFSFLTFPRCPVLTENIWVFLYSSSIWSGKNRAEYLVGWVYKRKEHAGAGWPMGTMLPLVATANWLVKMDVTLDDWSNFHVHSPWWFSASFHLLWHHVVSGSDYISILSSQQFWKAECILPNFVEQETWLMCPKLLLITTTEPVQRICLLTDDFST